VSGGGGEDEEGPALHRCRAGAVSKQPVWMRASSLLFDIAKK